MRISQIQPAMLESEAGDELDKAEENHWSEYLHNMVAAIIGFDEERIEEIYNEVLSLYPIDLVTRMVLKPLLIELGLRWETEIGSVAEEHFFAFFLRNKLGARFHHRSRNDGPRLLLAGLPGEFHEIALLLFALAAHEKGFTLITLGANMPMDELPFVAEKTRCEAIILSGAIQPSIKTINQDLPKLMKHLNIPVFIGGPSSVFACDTITKAGAKALQHLEAFKSFDQST
jgi:methanogenic corrinoid protein MtbC1